VLLAAHAFVPVAELYRRLDAAQRAGDGAAAALGAGDVRERGRAIVAKNGEALAVLEAHAEPTETGRALLDELARLHREHVRWAGEGA
jgi:HEXXH motif-containing protein